MSKHIGFRITDESDKRIKKSLKTLKTFDGKKKKQTYSNRLNELLNIALEMEGKC
jgi:hypothetical protein